MATEARRGFRRDETGGAPTLRMHPRNPFLAYIHFRCDKVERERESERKGERETERKIGLVSRRETERDGEREVEETARADTK